MAVIKKLMRKWKYIVKCLKCTQRNLMVNCNKLSMNIINPRATAKNYKINPQIQLSKQVVDIKRNPERNIQFKRKSENKQMDKEKTSAMRIDINSNIVVIILNMSGLYFQQWNIIHC